MEPNNRPRMHRHNNLVPLPIPLLTNPNLSLSHRPQNSRRNGRPRPQPTRQLRRVRDRPRKQRNPLRRHFHFHFPLLGRPSRAAGVLLHGVVVPIHRSRREKGREAPRPRRNEHPRTSGGAPRRRRRRHGNGYHAARGAFRAFEKHGCCGGS